MFYTSSHNLINQTIFSMLNTTEMEPVSTEIVDQADKSVHFAEELADTAISIDEMRLAARHYAKKRDQSRKYYKLNPDKCKQYNQRRASRAKVPKTDLDAAESKVRMTKEEKAAKAREYARQKYQQNKEASALRQKVYREKRRAAYVLYLRQLKNGEIAAFDASDNESAEEEEQEEVASTSSA